MNDPRDLKLELTLDAPREKVWRCWTEAELLKQWFAPKPYTTPRAELDVRVGGKTFVVIRSPDGEEMENPGVYLEVEQGSWLVFTDAYTDAWTPSKKPFLTIVITFDDAPQGGTHYVARVRHWSVEDRDAHEKMGFLDGWTQCARQLESLARTL